MTLLVIRKSLSRETSARRFSTPTHMSWMSRDSSTSYRRPPRTPLQEDGQARGAASPLPCGTSSVSSGY